MSIKKNFSSRLSLYILLVSAGLMIALTILLGTMAYNVVMKNSKKQAEMSLDQTILRIENVITEVERAVDNLDWVVRQNLGREDRLYEVTRELVSANPNIIGSAVAFEPGFYKGRAYFAPYSYVGDLTHEMHTIQMGNENYDYPTLDWYQIPKLLGRPYWSEPYYDDGGGGQRMSTYSMPLKDEEGNIYGILTADISLDWLSDLVSTIKPYEESYTLIIGRNGAYIAHPDSLKVLNETIFTSAMEMTDPKASQIGRDMLAGKTGEEKFNNDGENSFVVYGPLSNGWSVGLVSTYDDVFGTARALMYIIVFFLIVGLILLFFWCRRIVRKLTMPIVEFSNTAMTIAKGNFKAIIPQVERRDEIRTLHDSLDYMQQSINEYIVELKSTTASNERYESELSIGREIQMSLLPQDFPERDDLSLYAMVQPAKEVGGDLYDFIVVGDTLYFLVGDVSGKGVPAALFMAIARSAFRFVGAMGLSMADVMQRVNNCLCDGNKNDMFVTIFAGRLDLKTGDMEYCNAGHNPIVIVSPDGKPSLLHAKPNLAAGLFVDFPYQSESLHLESGTRLVLYTDGVTEAEKEDKSQFGEDRLLEWAGKLNPQASANAAVSDLYAHVKHFTRGAEQNDDITILSILYERNNQSNKTE